MAKLTNVRERVHQPFFDTLIRTSGLARGSLNARENLFTSTARVGSQEALTNFEGGGSALPSDQSHVTLALRVFTWFRAPTVRAGTTTPTINGDFSVAGATDFFAPGQPGAGNAIGNYNDVYRLHWQSQEQLHWSFGTGQKKSITNMATKYFPDGGGLSGDNGGVTDLVHWQNGDPSHQSILKLARAILLPPRQNVICEAVMTPLPDFGNGNLAGTVQNSRNMLSITDNLNAADGISKVVQFTFDGLFARDVQ